MVFRRRHNRNFLTALMLIGALVALWWGLGFASRKPAEDPQDFQGPQNAPSVDERGEAVGTPPDGADAVPDEPGTPPGEFQLAVILEAEENAAALLSGSAGKEGIARFWFAFEREVYVEYRRAGQPTVDRMAFLVASGDPAALVLTRQALYGLGDAGWELLEGTEALFIKPQRDLYEKDSSGQWSKKN